MESSIRVRIIVAGTLAASAAAGAIIGGQPASARAEATTGHVQSSIKWGECPELAPGAKRDPRQTCGTVKVPLDYRHPQGRDHHGRGLQDRHRQARQAARRPAAQSGRPGSAGPGHARPDGADAAEAGAGLLRPDRVRPARRRPQHPDELRPVRQPASSTLFPYPGAGGSIKGNVTTGARRRQAVRQRSVTSSGSSPARTRRATWIASARRSARGRSPTGASPSAPTSARSTRSLFPAQHRPDGAGGQRRPEQGVGDRSLNTWNQGMNDRFPDAARVAAAHNASLGLGGTAARSPTPTSRWPTASTASRPRCRARRRPSTVRCCAASPTRCCSTTKRSQRSPSSGRPRPTWPPARPRGTRTSPCFGRSSPSTPAAKGVPADNQATMALAMICGDTAWSHDVDSYADATAAARAKYPLSAGMPNNIWPCAFWSKQPIEPLVKVTSHGSAQRPDPAEPPRQRHPVGRGPRNAQGTG